MVLSYSWLTCYNLGIDWVLRCITYHPTVLWESFSMMSAERSAGTVSASGNLFPPSSDPPPNTPPPSISLINAAAFLQATKLPESQSFCVHLSDLSKSASACRAKLSEEPVDLSNIPSEYHNFADVFSEARTNTLTPHHSYDLKINLDKSMSPPWGLIYSLPI